MTGINYVNLSEMTETVFSAVEILKGWDRNAVIKRISHPYSLRVEEVPWLDDRGFVRISSIYYVNYSTLSGPGRCFFIPGLGPDEIACRAFALLLTGSLWSGGPGLVCGADVDTHRLSDGESMRFCRAFADTLPRNRVYEGLFDSLPDRERGYLMGRCSLSGAGIPASGKGGMGLAHFADEVLRRRCGGGLWDRSFAVTGRGSLARAAAETALRLGARPASGGADVWFLCDDEEPLSPADAASLLEHRPDGIFGGVCLPCLPEAEALIRDSGVLYAPGFLAGAGAALSLPSGVSHWEAEGLIRRSMRDLLDRCGEDLYRDACRLAVGAAAEDILRRGV